VWRARHEGSGQEVALKVLLAHRASHPRAMALLRDEIRAIAALDHPRIVQILGLGEVEDPAPPGVPVGSPWFAMELGRGTLKAVDSFDTLVAALELLLDALGHAHARGLLHLDLKPGNVLLGCEERDDVARGRLAGLRLSDFGLARSWRTVVETGSAQGTPAYMPPEQLRAQVRRFGPWTDIYALGHMAWELATGARAMSGSVNDVVRAQLSAVLPAFHPVFPVPRGFHDWLRWCLAHRPTARPQSAAEARAGLQSLLSDERATTGTVASPPSLPTGDTTILFDAPAPAPGAEAVAGTTSWPAPRFPERPGRPDAWGRLRGLPDAGLDVAALRAPRLVGRDDAVDQLWAAARRVHEGATPEQIRIRGGAGSGRRRLVTSIAQALCESVGASTLWVRADDDGVGPALRRWMSGEGLDGEALRDRLEEALEVAGGSEPWRVDGLAQWLSKERSPSAAERVHLLAGAWTRRMLVMVVEGGSPDVVAWLDALRASAEPAQVLVLWVNGPEGDEALVLQPLSDHAMESLLRSWFGLAPAVADRVAAHARGLPGAAVHVVHALREQGLLQPGPRGLTLGAGVELPDVSVPDQAWLRRVIDTVDEPTLHALERVAVDRSAWGDVGPEQVEALVAAGLVRRSAGGWTLGGEGERGALRGWAEAHGRLAEWRRRAARHPDVPVGRRGEHLLAAGHPLEAARAFLAAGREDFVAGAFRSASHHASRAAVALELAQTPLESELWGEQRHLALDGVANRGLVAEVRERAPSLLEDADRHGWEAAAARAQELRGWVAHLDQHNQDAVVDADRAADRWARIGRPSERARAVVFGGMYRLAAGDLEGALEQLEAVLPDIASRGDARMWVTAHVARANTLQRLGQLEASEKGLRQAYAGSEDDPTGRGRVCRQLVVTLTQGGRPEEALPFVEESVELCRRAGTWVAMAQTLNLKGEVLRDLGDLDGAAKAYLEAIDLALRQGHDAFHPSLNLAFTLLLLGQDDQALERVEALDPGDHMLEGLVMGWIAVVAHARSGRWMSARALAAGLVGEGEGLHERDLVALRSLAEEVAAGDPQLAAILAGAPSRSLSRT